MKKIFMLLKNKAQSGMSALLVVVIIGAASILMAKGAAFLSMGELDMSQVINHGNNALYLAESCLSEALFQLKKDENFLPFNKVIEFSEGSCVMSVESSGEEKIILTTGIDGEYRKSLEARARVISGSVYLGDYNLVEN